MTWGAYLVGLLCSLFAYLYLRLTDPSYNSGGQYTAPVLLFAFLIGLQCCECFRSQLIHVAGLKLELTAMLFNVSPYAKLCHRSRSIHHVRLFSASCRTAKLTHRDIGAQICRIGRRPPGFSPAFSRIILDDPSKIPSRRGGSAACVITYLGLFFFFFWMCDVILCDLQTALQLYVTVVRNICQTRHVCKDKQESGRVELSI